MYNNAKNIFLIIISLLIFSFISTPISHAQTTSTDSTAATVGNTILGGLTGGVLSSGSAAVGAATGGVLSSGSVAAGTATGGFVTSISTSKAKTLGELLKDQNVISAWKFVLSLINYIIIIALIAIAFANILRIQIDSYAIKKILPTLIVAIILANFSFLICQMIMTFNYALTQTIIKYLATGGDTSSNIFYAVYEKIFPGLAVGAVTLAAGGLAALAIPGIGPVGLILGLVLGLVLVALPLIVFVIIWFLMLIRLYIVILLVVLSPLAFFSLALPMTSQYFKMWWSNFTKWVFMPAASFFVISLALRIADAFVNSSSTANVGGLTTTTDVGGTLIKYAFLLGSLILAIIIPFKLGGAVMGAWGNLGKWVGKQAWGGYGSAMGALGNRKDANGNPTGLAKFAKATNLYGAGQAWKERLELAEKHRMDSFRDTGVYSSLAGEEAAFRFKNKDRAESIRGIQSQKSVNQKLKNENMTGYGQFNRHLSSIADPVERREFLDTFLTGPQGASLKKAKEAGINHDQASWLRGLITQHQYLERRGRGVDPLDTMDNINTQLTAPMSGAAAGAQAQGGAAPGKTAFTTDAQAPGPGGATAGRPPSMPTVSRIGQGWGGFANGQFLPSTQQQMADEERTKRLLGIPADAKKADSYTGNPIEDRNLIAEEIGKITGGIGDSTNHIFKNTIDEALKIKPDLDVDTSGLDAIKDEINAHIKNGNWNQIRDTISKKLDGVVRLNDDQKNKLADQLSNNVDIQTLQGRFKEVTQKGLTIDNIMSGPAALALKGALRAIPSGKNVVK